MARKTEMPEDVRRMPTGRNDVVRVSAPNTTRAEKEHRRKITDEERERNRPRLERANPNAVDVEEMRTQLRAALKDESSPEQVALRGYMQAIRDGRGWTRDRSNTRTDGRRRILSQVKTESKYLCKQHKVHVCKGPSGSHEEGCWPLQGSVIYVSKVRRGPT